jgi:tetratricopeptide (TPR) repeat protein
VYVESSAERYVEPVGEAVAPSEPSGTIPAPAAAQSPLSIAAQRYLELGDRAFREGRYTDAVQFYAKAVEFAPDQGALYLVLADALFAAGDYHYGAYSVRRALELDPALVESQVDKHSFYPDPAQFDAQLDQLERYIAEHPTDRDARLVLGLNYLFGGRPMDAERTLSGAAMSDDVAAQKILARARVQSQSQR